MKTLRNLMPVLLAGIALAVGAQELQRHTNVMYPSPDGEWVLHEDYLAVSADLTAYPGWHTFDDTPEKFPIVVFKGQSRYHIRLDADTYEKYKDSSRTTRSWSWWAYPPALDSSVWKDPMEEPPVTTYDSRGQILSTSVWVEQEDDNGNLYITTRNTYFGPHWSKVRRYAYFSPDFIRAK